MRRPRHVIVGLVYLHEGLELNRILRADQSRVWVVKVQKVVHLGRVELAWPGDCSSSHGTAALLWHTTPVIAQEVHVVLFPLPFQLGLTLFSVAAWHWSCHRNVASLVSGLWVVRPFKLFLADLIELIRVAASQQVVVGA